MRPGELEPVRPTVGWVYATERGGAHVSRRDVHRLWNHVTVTVRNLEISRFTAVAVSVMYVLGGGIALVVNAISPALLGGAYDPLYSWVTIGVGLMIGVLPWSRWKPRWKLFLPVSAIVLTSAASRSDGAAFGSLLAVYPLAFVLAGFTVPPGSSLLLAVPAALVLYLLNPLESSIALAGLLILVPISVLVGEAVAQLVRRQERSEEHLAHMLSGVRVLARTDDEQKGAERFASLVCELVEVDASVAFFADARRAGRLVRTATAGSDDLTVHFPGSAHVLDLPDRIVGDHVAFSTNPALVSEQMRTDAEALVSIPLRDRENRLVGLAFGLWETARLTLPNRGRQAAELLGQEGGRMVERLRDTQRLTREARTDPLTQLANRRTFTRALETVQPGDAIVIVDLDHFKLVNDTFGHEVGDETLRELAEAMRRVARQVDTVARYGGEEFALVLADADREGALAMVERLRTMWHASDPRVTFSAGIAVHRDGDLVEWTLRAADGALYEAKSLGRDCVCLAGEAPGELSAV